MLSEASVGLVLGEGCMAGRSIGLHELEGARQRVALDVS